MQLQHFQPSSPLFKPHERNGIIASNVGLTVMSCILYLWKQQVGFEYFFKLYFVPYLVGHTGLPQNLCRCLTSVGVTVVEPLDRDVDLPSSLRSDNRSLP